MIPTQAGEFIIPEISIPWWNTRTGKQELAELPETVIEATGMASSPQMPQPIEMIPPPAQTDEQQAESTTVIDSASAEGIINPAYWPWISLALAIGWITTTILFFRSNHPRIPAGKPAPLPPRTPCLSGPHYAGETTPLPALQILHRPAQGN